MNLKSTKRSLRLVAWGSILGVTLLLFSWSRENDPRFFYFMTSQPGRAVGEFLRWKELVPSHVDQEVSRQNLTKRERQVLLELEDQLLGATPSHHLVLKGGRSMLGRILDEGPGSIRFQESFGSNGSLSARIRRSRILHIEPYNEPPPRITYRDIRFKIDFPELSLFKRHPYTVATDEKYFKVEGMVKSLQRLHGEFLGRFEPLVTNQERHENIQVLFFAQEEMFRTYQKKYAPNMENGVGYYSPAQDRLTVFNQHNSEHMASYGERLDEQAERYRQNPGMYGGRGRIDQWKKDAGRQMLDLADQQTRETVRHEGAHQLFFTYGIHSEHRIENDWLFEGLAVYCETEILGAKNAYRVATLHRALQKDTLIPVSELVEHRSQNGLFAYGSEAAIDLAYSQSWALVHFLMQPERREAFFEYIHYLREREHFWPVYKRSRFELLCESIGKTPEQFNDDWNAYIAQL